MQKLIPKLTRFVAIQKLEEHYSFTNQQAMQLSAMRLFAEELCAQESYARHFIFRIMKAETDHTLVNAVLQSLPEDYQKYIKLKYIGHKNVVGLATSLYTSPSQLNVWHDKIVTQVQNALSYRLTLGDIYDYKSSTCWKCWQRYSPRWNPLTLNMKLWTTTGLMPSGIITITTAACSMNWRTA